MRATPAALAAALFLIVIAALPIASRAADYFGRPEGAPAAPHPALAPLATVQAQVPSALRPLVAWAAAEQSRLNARLRNLLRAAGGGASLRPAFVIVAISFLYGVVHALGPGHGKVVVCSYFLSRRSRVLHGLAMSGTAALVQALAALVLVGVLVALLDVSVRRALDNAATLETVSYGAIVLLGLWMLRAAFVGHGHQHGLGHDDDDDDEHDYDHDDRHRHDGNAGDRASSLGQVIAAGAAVGLRPCSGAILVLLFSLANGIFVVGVVATFAMGFGVAITVASVSLGMVGLRRALGHLRPWGLGEGGGAARVVAALGAILVAAFGCLQFLAAISGVLVPTGG